MCSGRGFSGPEDDDHARDVDSCSVTATWAGAVDVATVPPTVAWVRPGTPLTVRLPPAKRDGSHLPAQGADFDHAVRICMKMAVGTQGEGSRARRKC